MKTSAAQRQKTKRSKDAARGIRQHNIVCHDDDWPKIKRFATELKRQRASA